jgi:uncharacterized membrane protein
VKLTFGAVRRGPLLLVATAAAGVAVALYLSLIRLAGGLPACGPVAGCDTVALSEYSQIAGIPVAFMGAAYSLVMLAASVAWIRTHDPRLLWVAYGLATLGVIFAGYLTYLELFVIHAICIWCVAYAVALVMTWLLLAKEMRRPNREPAAKR